MTVERLRHRVASRDRLVAQAESGRAELHEEVMGALRHGDLARVEAAIVRSDAQLEALAENLRIYQAELHAQADELAASQLRTEAALERFAALFEHMPIPAMRVAFDGAVLELNGRAAELFSPRGGAPVHFLHRVIDAADFQARVRPGFFEARSNGSCALEEIGFAAADGRRFLGELHIAALPGADLDQGHFVCLLIDRSEHHEDLRALRESAEALRVSEAYLADTATLARLGGWEYRRQPRALSWSREVRALLEVDAETPASFEATLASCLPASQPLLVHALDGAAQQGVPFEIEIDMVSARGRPMRVLAVGHPDRIDGPSRVFGVFQDITSQHAARQRIGELTEHLSMATEAGGIGIWDWDLGRDHLFLDGRMHELLGLAEPPPSGLIATLRACLVPEDAQAVEDALQRARVDHEPLSLEVRLARPGPHAWLHLTGRAHFDHEAHAVRLVGCAWDCGAEKEAARIRSAKEAAEFASRSKSAFLSRMSHELRTPLNAVLGFAQVMQMEAQAGDLVVKPHRLDLIEGAARHLLDLINEVLDVSGIETGHVAVKHEPVELHSVLREALAMVLPQLEAAGLRLTQDLGPGTATVDGDRLRLRQVLLNLLSNAVKYNGHPGTIAVTLRRVGERVTIAVADSGRGLDAQQIAGLFQPFNRVGAERTPVEGSGMGLYVSKRFVELMGGTIAVTSQPRVGSTFTVTLAAGPAG